MTAKSSLVSASVRAAVGSSRTSSGEDERERARERGHRPLDRRQAVDVLAHVDVLTEAARRSPGPRRRASASARRRSATGSDGPGRRSRPRRGRRPWPAPGTASTRPRPSTPAGTRGGARGRRHADAAPVGRHDPGHDLDERRLAGAVLAEQGVDLAGSDVQVEVAQDDRVAVRLAQAAHGEHGSFGSDRVADVGRGRVPPSVLARVTSSGPASHPRILEKTRPACCRLPGRRRRRAGHRWPILPVMVGQQHARGDLVARGNTSDVWQWTATTVVKVLRPDIPRHWAALEADITQRVHEAGLPVPATDGVVEVDGRPGVVLERIDGLSMWSQMKADPAELPRLVEVLVDLQSEVLLGRSARWGARPRVAAARQDRRGRSSCRRKNGGEAQALLAGLPVGSALCHGDMHPANLLMSARGPIIVDWFDAAVGYPLADLARSSLLMPAAERSSRRSGISTAPRSSCSASSTMPTSASSTGAGLIEAARLRGLGGGPGGGPHVRAGPDGRPSRHLATLAGQRPAISPALNASHPSRDEGRRARGHAGHVLYILR